MHLGNIACGVRYDRGRAYLHVKLHFCAEQLGIQSHQLSVFVMEIELETTGAEKQELSKNNENNRVFFFNLSRQVEAFLSLTGLLQASQETQ